MERRKKSQRQKTNNYMVKVSPINLSGKILMVWILRQRLSEQINKKGEPNMCCLKDTHLTETQMGSK